ncbi:uncharacterized protein LOC124496376 isoform X2 [Dermatophagoides farinae]|uniref:uncharacterized protein LOC124496376 isoform X2 n=1 Tax=Dermatophagoides farinae TaxID=6954 RepID=UPI001F0DDB25|nr:uncharacterized protein LOC124496376 isoform X2 [Dermatophagoides farinae]
MESAITVKIISDSITTTISPSTSKTEIYVNDEDIVEKDKRRANELIKSMRRMPNWHMTNHYIGNNKMMTMNNYKHHNAQFANGWRAVPLPKIGKVPIKIHSSSVAIPVVIPIVTTTTTTTTTEKPIPSPTTTSATIEISSIDFSPIPVMHIINQQPKPMMIENNDDDDRNNQTYAMKCFIDGKQYSNGEQISITTDDDNPCTYCRCFYGQKICQQHICPSAPSLDCLAEQKNGQCCPVYTCGKTTTNVDNNSEQQSDDLNSNIDQSIVFNHEQSLPIRSRGPQFVVPINHQPTDDSTIPLSSTNHSQRRNGMLMPMNPLEFLYNNPLVNRVHFPSSSSTQSPIIEMKENWPIVNPNSIKFNPQLPTNDIMRINNNKDKDKNLPNFDSKDEQIGTNISSPIRTQPQSPVRPIFSTHKLIPSSNEQNLLPPPSSSQSQAQSSSTYIPMIMTISTVKPFVTSSTKVVPNIQTSGGNNLMTNLFQVSGCNIYGKMYKTQEQIPELSDQCKWCICSISGVKCTNNC